jgi:hypothetical protein
MWSQRIKVGQVRGAFGLMGGTQSWLAGNSWRGVLARGQDWKGIKEDWDGSLAPAPDTSLTPGSRLPSYPPF